MNPYEYVCHLPVSNPTGAQQSIEQALLALYAEKDLYQISVKELCSKANVARSTFYTYYDVLDDCLLEIENRTLRELLVLNDAISGQEKISELDLSFYRHTIAYIKAHQALLSLFLLKRPNYRFIGKWKDAIKYHLYSRMPSNENERNKGLTLEMLAAQLIGAYQYWLQNPYDLDFAYVEKLMRKTLEVYIEQ